MIGRTHDHPYGFTSSNSWPMRAKLRYTCGPTYTAWVNWPPGAGNDATTCAPTAYLPERAAPTATAPPNWAAPVSTVRIAVTKYFDLSATHSNGPVSTRRSPGCSA